MTIYCVNLRPLFFVERYLNSISGKTIFISDHCSCFFKKFEASYIGIWL